MSGVDTIYAGRHFIITSKEAIVISDINIYTLAQTFVIALLANLLVLLAYVMLRGIDKMYDVDYKRDNRLRRGLNRFIWFTWAVDAFCLIAVPRYEYPWILLVVVVTILLYELLKLMSLLGKIGFAPGKFLKIISAMTKAATTKDASAVADMLEEFARDERLMRGEEKRRNKRPPTTPLILLLFLPLFIASGTETKREEAPRENIVYEVSRFRKIDIRAGKHDLYSVIWVQVEK